MAEPQVVCIGAGPVGLYTAIQIKLYCPELNIRMYEKYEEYQRKHVLKIDADSYKEAHPSPEFQAILKDLSGMVPTSYIEERLVAFAQELGIEMVYERVDSINALFERHPDCKIFIGADGSHSLMRQEIFKDRKKTEENLQYIAEYKYSIEGSSKELDRLTHYVGALSLTNHFVTEYIGKEKEGTSQISIRFFIDEETFAEMQELGVSFKNPLSLQAAKEIQTPGIRQLRESLEAWLIARGDLQGDTIIEDSGKLTAINLPIYRSEHFSEEVEDRKCFLVGDAAMGVPYFRALNAGFLCANSLADCIAKDQSPEEKADVQKRKKILFSSSYAGMSAAMSKKDDCVLCVYERAAESIAENEIGKARIKNWGVNSAMSSAASIQTVPISKKKIPGRTRRAMQQVKEQEESNSSCSIM